MKCRLLRTLILPDIGGRTGQAIFCGPSQPGHRLCRRQARALEGRRAHSGGGRRRRWRFVAAAARDGPIAPWLRGRVMIRDRFGTCIARERTPAVRPRQFVVAGTPPSLNSSRAIRLRRAPGQWADLSSILPARSCPDRDQSGLHPDRSRSCPCHRKAQDPDPESRRHTLWGTLQGGWPSLRPGPAAKMPKPPLGFRPWPKWRAARSIPSRPVPWRRRHHSE